MSQLIPLSGCRHVAAEVQPMPSSQTIAVRMKDGQIHTHRPEYNVGLYESVDRLVKAINYGSCNQGMQP